MPFRNSPELKDENNEGRVKRYVHQPFTIEQHGIHAKIQENGRVLISSGVTLDANNVETYDEIEIDKLLVFEISSLLKATRNTQLRDGGRKTYTHQPLVIEKHNVQISIKENGKILLTSPDRLIEGTKDKYEYDEVEISASLIFKLVTLLKATQTVKFVSTSEKE